MRTHILAACLLAGLKTGFAQTSTAPFCETIRTLTQDPTVAAAHWGVMVTTLEGKLLCGVNQAQLFRPASNDKLFTTSAALALLGATKTFDTRVTGTLDAATGTITGDLTLVGGGDANLDSGDIPYVPPASRPKPSPGHAAAPTGTRPPFRFHDLDDLAAQLAAAGVKSVQGSVVGDDTLFPWEPYAPSWAADDLVWGYGAPISALTIADNELQLTVTPGRISGTPGHESFPPATVTLEQNGVPYYTLQAQVGTLRAKASGGVNVERVPGSRVIRVYGAIAEDAAPDIEHIAIDDPAAYAALAFRGILVAHGITVAGASRASHRSVSEAVGFQNALAEEGMEELTVAGGEGGGSCMVATPQTVLATHHSAAVADDVSLTDKVSQNLHAEILLHQLGRRVFCGQGSNVAGVRMVRAFLFHAGVEKDDLFLFDGSGLSAHDLTTPRALNRLLVFAATQPWFGSLKAALPVGGVDGSLTSRFIAPDSVLKGRVFAKTGTLGESRALSGYVTAASGQTLVFSVMDDNHAPGSSADRVIMDRIVETIAAQN